MSKSNQPVTHMRRFYKIHTNVWALMAIGMIHQSIFGCFVTNGTGK
jgi:hypothetical protein